MDQEATGVGPVTALPALSANAPPVTTASPVPPWPAASRTRRIST
jgi:hypothetical protein